MARHFVNSAYSLGKHIKTREFPSTDSLNIVVVAERLRSGLHDVLDRAVSSSAPDTDDSTFGLYLSKAATDMLNEPSMEIDSTIRDLLMEVDVPGAC
ncbi:unnamed protein product [Mesocestoides corti]|uniref:KR domain-containing protein n=1 Tax=Mesocestoides corti TaxID=53468 RepID=A0A0R3UP96_MESCO|nr:unnamed protein product [Mesocestoides corti]